MSKGEDKAKDTQVKKRVLKGNKEPLLKMWQVKNRPQPKDWNKGLISKLPKEDDLSNCDNWQEINLLSKPSKFFFRISLKRINTAVDMKLEQEQGLFQSGVASTKYSLYKTSLYSAWFGMYLCIST